MDEEKQIQEFVRTLERIGKLAKAGQLRGIALAYLDPEGGQVFSASSSAESVTLLLGHVTAIQNSLAQNYRSFMNEGLRPVS